ARRERARVPGRARSARGQRDGGGRGERPGERSRMSAGRLFGVGVGPGDPELVTVKARRLIESADVVAYPVAQKGRGVARGVAAPYLREGQIELALVYPVTTEEPSHAGGSEGAMHDFYDASAAEIAAHPDYRR